MKNTIKKITLSTALATALFVTAPIKTQAISILGTSIDEATLPMQLIQNLSLVKEVTQTAEQIRQYAQMLKTIGELPQQQWDQFQSLFLQLKSSVDFGSGINANATDYSSKFQNLFLGYEGYLSMAAEENGASACNTQCTSIRTALQDTVKGTLKKLNFSLEDMESDEATMRQLQTLSKTATGQKAAIQAASEIALHQTHSLKKLHATMTSFANLEAQNIATNNAEKLIEQAKTKRLVKPIRFDNHK